MLPDEAFDPAKSDPNAAAPAGRPTPQDLLRADHDALAAKLSELAAFIGKSPAWDHLISAEQDRLVRQHQHMTDLLKVMHERLRHAEDAAVDAVDRLI